MYLEASNKTDVYSSRRSIIVVDRSMVTLHKAKTMCWRRFEGCGGYGPSLRIRRAVVVTPALKA